MRNTYRISAVTAAADKVALTRELAENMREIDRKEIEGMGFSTFDGAKVSIYETSPVYIARTAEGKLIGCWGLQYLMGREGTKYLIWALGTDELDNYPKAFVKESKALIDRWLELYGELTNTVACFNTRSIKWLKWLGAEFSDPYKIGNTDYIDFTLKRKR